MRRGIAVVFAFACGCSSSPTEEADEEPTCGAPPVLAVPIATSHRSGEPLHWRADRCIDVTYAALSAAQVADLSYALDAWSGLGCSSLCFNGPTESDASLEGSDGRLHVTTATNFPASSTVVYLDVSGRIRGALIDVSVTQSRGELVRQLGLDLGLARPTVGVDSVLALGSAATAPTASDAETLCALYGRPPLCE
jgi:hypothetical protein